MSRPEPSMFDGMPGSILVKGHNRSYERKGIYSLKLVLGNLNVVYAAFDGDLINMQSERYRVFEKSLTCVGCGLMGRYFAKERTTRSSKIPFYVIGREPWHFNLYAIKEPWEEVLMTKDHIWPKSKGGKNDLSNLQTMCFWCNVAKANSIPDGGRRLMTGRGIVAPEARDRNPPSIPSSNEKQLV